MRKLGALAQNGDFACAVNYLRIRSFRKIRRLLVLLASLRFHFRKLWINFVLLCQAALRLVRVRRCTLAAVVACFPNITLFSAVSNFVIAIFINTNARVQRVINCTIKNAAARGNTRAAAFL